MPTVERTDRWRPSATFGLAACGVALGFLLGGFQGALGALGIAIGLTMLARARRRLASIPRAACTFLVREGAQPIATMLFRVPDGPAEAMADHLRDHGWGMLEPPFDGPLSPVHEVGVEFRGDHGLVVLHLRGLSPRRCLVADQLSELPQDWARAAEESGFVLLLLDDGRSPTDGVPMRGAYALLRGVRAMP